MMIFPKLKKNFFSVSHPNVEKEKGIPPMSLSEGGGFEQLVSQYQCHSLFLQMLQANSLTDTTGGLT